MMAESPTEAMSWNVNRKPYSMIPSRKIFFDEKVIPGSHSSYKGYSFFLQSYFYIFCSAQDSPLQNPVSHTDSVADISGED